MIVRVTRRLRKKRIVILGGGFGGVYAAIRLEKLLARQGAGRRIGVARIFGFNFSGFFAWWMWRTVYLSKLPL
jgi:NADH dehydrogenase FAD-containing subunit